MASTRGSLIVASESDGHFQAAGWLACGQTALWRQVAQGAWPAGFPSLVAALRPLTGDGLLAARLVSVGALGLLVAAVGAAAWTVWRSPGAVLLAGGLAALTPQLLTYGTLGTTDALAAALLATALPPALGAADAERPWRLAALAGVALGLATQVRYQAFPPALATVAALGLATAGAPARRAGVVGAAAVGLVAAIAACAALPGVELADLGGLRLAASAVPQAQGAPWSGGGGSLASRYALSALLASWLLGLPAVGLVQLAVGGLDPSRRGRDRWLPLAPAVVAFVAVGWFPTPERTELRRLFLPLLPAAVLGATALVRRLAAGRGRPAIAVVAGLHGALTVNQLFGEIPLSGMGDRGVPGPEIGFVVPARAWDFDREPGHAEAVATTLARLDDLGDHLAAHPPGCGLAITDDVGASRRWPSAWLEPGLDAARLAERVAGLVPTEPPAWVIVDPARTHVDASTSLPGWRLEPAPSPVGLRVLRLVPAAAPVAAP